MYFNFNGQEVKICFVFRPKNKRIYIRYKDGALIVSSYKRLNEQQLHNLIKENFQLLEKFMQKQKKIEPESCMHFFGQKYSLQTILSKSNHVQIEDGCFVVYTKSLEPKPIRTIIHDFYNQEMQKYVEQVINSIFLNFADLGVLMPVISYKYLKSCYGYYIKQKHEIIFSGMSAKLDPKYINYVIYHELAHILYMHHQKPFYDYLERKLPNCKKIQKEIRNLHYTDKY